MQEIAPHVGNSMVQFLKCALCFEPISAEFDLAAQDFLRFSQRVLMAFEGVKSSHALLIQKAKSPKTALPFAPNIPAMNGEILRRGG